MNNLRFSNSCCVLTVPTTLKAAFCCLAFSINPVKSVRWLVGAVGIGLKAILKIRKLFIPLDGKNAKNQGFIQPRYTPGTRGDGRVLKSRGLGADASAGHV